MALLSSRKPASGYSIVPEATLWAGTLLLPLRLIVGWTYFSAFWRRLVLENKLIPDTAGYVGEKFNHFLPNSFILVRPMIEYFVSHPGALWWMLVVFTLVEAVVGLALMLGFMTRATGLATSGLALGILLGAGWLGTTCLDEWQIGVLGVASGVVFTLAGGGRCSLDYLVAPRLGQRRFARWAGWAWAVETPAHRLLFPAVLAATVATFGLTLLTNQVFHGGVWGPLHNKSVRPKVEVSDARLAGDALSVRLYRVEGADVYGSFAIGVRVLDHRGVPLVEWSAEQLATLKPADIANHYVTRVEPGPHSLVIPLGAKADITLRDARLRSLPPGEYRVEVLDVSGLAWQEAFRV